MEYASLSLLFHRRTQLICSIVSSEGHTVRHRHRYRHRHTHRHAPLHARTHPYIYTSIHINPYTCTYVEITRGSTARRLGVASTPLALSLICVQFACAHRFLVFQMTGEVGGVFDYTYNLNSSALVTSGAVAPSCVYVESFAFSFSSTYHFNMVMFCSSTVKLYLFIMICQHHYEIFTAAHQCCCQLLSYVEYVSLPRSLESARFLARVSQQKQNRFKVVCGACQRQ